MNRLAGMEMEGASAWYRTTLGPPRISTSHNSPAFVLPHSLFPRSISSRLDGPNSLSVQEKKTIINGVVEVVADPDGEPCDAPPLRAADPAYSNDILEITTSTTLLGRSFGSY